MVGSLLTRIRAAVYEGDRRVDLEDAPVPEVGTHDVLLEASHCGVCDAEIHFVLDGRTVPDRIHGHGYSGTVVAQAFANYMRVRDNELLCVPDGVSLRHATVTEPLTVALHGLTRAGVDAGERGIVAEPFDVALECSGHAAAMDG